VEVKLSSPVRGEIEGAKHTVAQGILWGVVWTRIGKSGARLDINNASSPGYGLPESEGRAHSQHSQDEDSSFQWMASIGRSMGMVSRLV
jgi:hypothetical protein